MSDRDNPLCTLVADDLTGACDAAVQFVQFGYSAITALDWALIEHCRTDVIAATTDSRADAPSEAAEKVRILAGFLSPRRSRFVFKKIDSVLRGNIAREILAALKAFECDACIIAPSFPSLGRTVSGGWLRTAGEGGAAPIHLPTLLATQGMASQFHVDRTWFGGGTTGLAGRLETERIKGTRCFTFDAVSDFDLDMVAAASEAAGRRILWAGSAGLARQLAKHAAGSGRNRFSRAARPEAGNAGPGAILFAIGSDHPATLEQVKTLQDLRPVRTVRPTPADTESAIQAIREGRAVILQIDVRTTGRMALKEFLSGLQDAPIRGIVMSGGDTAALVCSALGAGSIRLEGEISAGIPWGRICCGLACGLPVATKSGGFGGAGALVETADFLGKCLRDPEV